MLDKVLVYGTAVGVLSWCTAVWTTLTENTVHYARSRFCMSACSSVQRRPAAACTLCAVGQLYWL